MKKHLRMIIRRLNRKKCTNYSRVENKYNWKLGKILKGVVK